MIFINDGKLLEQDSNQAPNPNFEDAYEITSLYAAASGGSAQTDKSRTDTRTTPSCAAAAKGHLQVAQSMVEHGANKDQGTPNDGDTLVDAAGNTGHNRRLQAGMKVCGEGIFGITSFIQPVRASEGVEVVAWKKFSARCACAC